MDEILVNTVFRDKDGIVRIVLDIVNDIIFISSVSNRFVSTITIDQFIDREYEIIHPGEDLKDIVPQGA